jgi:hypothetical protein
VRAPGLEPQALQEREHDQEEVIEPVDGDELPGDDAEDPDCQDAHEQVRSEEQGAPAEALQDPRSRRPKRGGRKPVPTDADQTGTSAGEQDQDQDGGGRHQMAPARR